MSIKTKITISSHKNFYTKTYEPLVTSLLESGVPAEDIYFFIGGFESYEKLDGEINIWTTNHNSIDFTGLIGVLDLNLQSDRWFLLHDTLYVGKNFYNCIQNTASNADTIDISSWWPKNMGSYSQIYLNHIKDSLITEYKNIDISEQAAHKFKTFNVDTENRFLCKQEFYSTERPYIVQDQIDFYESNNLRSVQYYPNIDIYKVQSCVNHPGNYNIKI
jgi:hypothetical protein